MRTQIAILAGIGLFAISMLVGRKRDAISTKMASWFLMASGFILMALVIR